MPNGQVYEPKDKQPPGENYQTGLIETQVNGQLMYYPFVNDSPTKLAAGDLIDVSTIKHYLTKEAKGFEFEIVEETSGGAKGYYSGIELSSELGIVIPEDIVTESKFIIKHQIGALASGQSIAFSVKLYRLHPTRQSSSDIEVDVVFNPTSSARFQGRNLGEYHKSPFPQS